MRAAFGQSVCPDCLWFTWHKADGVFSPLSYAQSLRFLREAAVASGLTSGMLQAQSLTLHSLKVCLLSTMLVLNIDRASRCAQGHHRGSAAELYSRDDVWSALQAQEVVLSKLQAGWLPLTPMGRGGQSPIQQLPLLTVREEKPHAVLSEAFPLLPDFSAADLGPPSCSAADEAALLGPKADSGATAPQLDVLQSQAKLPAQDFDSSSSDGESVDVESLGRAEEVVFLQAKSGVCHFASPTTAGTGSRHAELWAKTCVWHVVARAHGSSVFAGGRPPLQTQSVSVASQQVRIALSLPLHFRAGNVTAAHRSAASPSHFC